MLSTSHYDKHLYQDDVMDIKLLKLSDTVLTAIQILKLQVELQDGHSIRANRTVEELIELIEKALESRSSQVYQALIRLVSLLTDKQIIFFETLSVDFSPLRHWAKAQQAQQQNLQRSNRRSLFSTSAVSATTKV
ncbi:hypothetical protein [Oceanobacter antarcticus]|uniref:Uncharacterized protein n=2 Tax=Oceanospirillaceae TaxID=135620 RepID=A0ABW8NJZ2_9GAMM